MIEKINLEWIKSFVYFAESSGVDEAAKKLGITQPAITQHLKKLEYSLPKKLFARLGKKKILTEYGEDFYKKASTHLKNIDNLLRSSIHENNKESEVEFRLGINRDFYYKICDKIDFNGKLNIFIHKSETVVEELIKRNIDIGISRFKPDSTEVIAVKWFTDSYVLAFPKSWTKEIVKGKNQYNYLNLKKFILYSNTELLTQKFLSDFNLSLNELNISYKLSDWLSYIKLIDQGKGWGFVPSSFELSSDIQTIELSNKVNSKTQFYLLYHRSIKNYTGFRKLIESIILSVD